MVGQHKRLSEPLRWTRTGRIATFAVAVALAGASIAAVLVLLLASSTPPAGCIEVPFPSTLGASVAHACGARARSICASPAQSPALVAHGALRQACRQAGLPYGAL